MNKRILILSLSLFSWSMYVISGDLIGGALNLARGAVDTAANVADDTIDVVDRGTYPVRWNRPYPFGHHHHWHDEDEDLIGENVVIEKKITKTPEQVVIEKTITRRP